jgi:hypothetical protein
MPKRRIETSAVLTGAWAQLGVQPWYSAFPLPTAVGPPQDVHWTLLTNSVPSPVSCNEPGLSAASPTAPWKYTVAAFVVDVVAVVVPDDDAVVVAGVEAVPLVVEARFVTVVVEVVPQAASTGNAATTSRRRRRIVLDDMPRRRQVGVLRACLSLARRFAQSSRNPPSAALDQTQRLPRLNERS